MHKNAISNPLKLAKILYRIKCIAFVASTTQMVNKLNTSLSILFYFCLYLGNKMARHLVMCERKSAYPSKEDAKSACVKNRLLDTLGLVRKPDEQPPAVENDEPITIDSPPHNEMEESVMEELTKLDDINDINNQIEEEEEEVKEIKDSENENTNEPIYDVEMLNNDVTRNEMEVDQTETTNSNDNFIESTEISEKQKDNLEMETNVVLAGS